MTHHRWTPSEINYIKDNYSLVKVSVIAKRLNVTETMVRGVVKRYGLKKQVAGNGERHPYMRGFDFWSVSPFWRDPSRRGISEKTKAYYETWLEGLKNERRSDL